MQTSFAATTAETKAFNAAVNLLDTKLYGLAETNFAKFVEQHPDSTNRAQAILHQAQARFYQTNYAGTLELLQKQFSLAGALTNEYQFWMGQTFFKNGNYHGAADAFSALTKNSPESARQLEACYHEALAESKLGHWLRVIELLQTPGGKFETAVKSQPNSGFLADGYLLLADALLNQKRFEDAEKIIAQLNGRNLTPEAKWRQNFLLCRIQLAVGRPESALQTSTNLLVAAQESGNRRMYAESVLLRGEILEKLNRMPEAIQAYEQNFTEGSITNVPGDIRRQSFFKSVDLILALNDTTNAVRRLENFIDQNPADAALDLAEITLGELRLKQFISAAYETNLVAGALASFFDQALTNFNTVVTNFPQSQYLGRVYLDRGWCFWIQEKLSLAEADFLEATKRLPVSEDQAVARFKLADTQFKQTNYAAAVTNYQWLIQNHAGLERVTNSLFEPALFQTLRASLEIGNADAATNAMQKLLDWFPNGSFGDRSLLLVGQTFNRNGMPDKARNLFVDFLKRFPDSSRVPEIKLAIAQTYVQEKNWPAALAEYDGWVTNFAAHPLLPQGEFFRALVFEKAGQDTNAFNLFTNFVVRFPSHQLAALAQNWIADFYWNHDDYRNAEKSYQELYQKFNPAPPLAYQARLMAGRAAYDRSDYTEAAKYFKTLIELLDKDTNSPPAVAAEAWFALGDTLFQNFLANTNWVAEDFREAITALTRVTKDFSTNEISARAWGRMGDYYFQWAGLDSTQAEARYDRAQQCYGMVRDSAVADISSRSEAEVGVGKVCEKIADLKSGADRKAWLDAALDHYLKVVPANREEAFDAKWTYEAGMAAAKVCERLEDWEPALEIYNRLAKLLPVLKPALERKIAAAETHVKTAKN